MVKPEATGEATGAAAGSTAGGGDPAAREEAILFGASGTLVGILCRPSGPVPGRPAFLFLNAGVNHRVGPSGLYTKLARALAAQGFASLRFDYSGLGDSPARTDQLPAWQSVQLETAEAIERLEQEGIAQVVPLGICSGAINAYMTAQNDPRVVGAVLINAQAHLHGVDPALTEHFREKTMSRHGWRIALRSSYRAKNWKKMLSGKLVPKRVFEMLVTGPLKSMLSKVTTGPGPGTGPGTGTAAGADACQPGVRGPVDSGERPGAGLRELSERGAKVFHVYCEGDEGLDYFYVVLGSQADAVGALPGARFEVIAGANHVFSLRWSQERLVELVCGWAQETWNDNASSGGGTP